METKNFVTEDGTKIFVKELNITKKGNPVIDMCFMGIEAIYAHKTTGNVVLFQSENATIVKPMNGLLLKFKDNNTLYRVIKKLRDFKGDLLEAKANHFIQYWMCLIPSGINIDENKDKFNKIEVKEKCI